jgi:hypothetical protein
MDAIKSHVDVWLYSLAFESSLWAGETIKCARPEDSGPPPQNPIPNLGTPEKCPPWLRAVRMKWKLAFAEVEVNCERVKLELSGRLAGSKDNWIGAFGEVEYNAHTGKITVFGRPKAARSRGRHSAAPSRMGSTSALAAMAPSMTWACA